MRLTWNIWKKIFSALIFVPSLFATFWDFFEPSILCLIADITEKVGQTGIRHGQLAQEKELLAFLIQIFTRMLIAYSGLSELGLLGGHTSLVLRISQKYRTVLHLQGQKLKCSEDSFRFWFDFIWCAEPYAGRKWIIYRE